MARATVVREVRQLGLRRSTRGNNGGNCRWRARPRCWGVTARTFRRWRGLYAAEGTEGLQDHRPGRASACTVPVDKALRMVTLYTTGCTGWTVKHFHERWHTEHGGRRKCCY